MLPTHDDTVLEPVTFNWISRSGSRSRSASTHSRMTKQQVIDFLTDGFALANLPDTFLSLHEITNDPHSDIGDVVAVARRDPELAASLLRLANSSMYRNAGEPVDSIEEAAQLIGLREVVQSALALGIIKEIKIDHNCVDLRDYWRRSLAVAKVSEQVYELAPRFMRSRVERPALYTAGLLHDIGMLALMQGFADEMVSVVDISICEGLPIQQVEKREFGFSHQDVGRILFKKWSLPESLQCVAGFHHNPLELTRRIYTPMVDIVYISDYICYLCGPQPVSALKPEMHEGVWQRCSIRPSVAQDFAERVEAAAASADAILSC